MGAIGPRTIVLSLGGPLARSDLPALCARVRDLLAASDAELVLCDVSGLLEADAVALDALARLQLTARRLGRRMRLRHASDELGDLLVFTGLAEACGLPVEIEGEAEERKQRLGVEEEGELDDAAP
jgi:ABC-type transporter Mla MlaB component